MTEQEHSSLKPHAVPRKELEMMYKYFKNWCWGITAALNCCFKNRTIVNFLVYGTKLLKESNRGVKSRTHAPSPLLQAPLLPHPSLFSPRHWHSYSFSVPLPYCRLRPAELRQCLLPHPVQFFPGHPPAPQSWCCCRRKSHHPPRGHI